MSKPQPDVTAYVAKQRANDRRRLRRNSAAITRMFLLGDCIASLASRNGVDRLAIEDAIRWQSRHRDGGQ